MFPTKGSERQSRADGERQEKRRGGNAPVRFDVGVPGDGAAREFEEQGGESGDPMGVGEKGDKAERHDQRE